MARNPLHGWIFQLPLLAHALSGAVLFAGLSDSGHASRPTVFPMPGDVDYQRDVRPLLAAHCYPCHGPDAQAREAGLRLDNREGALAKAVIPGDPSASPLVQRITAESRGERMPPAKHGPGLDKAEIQVLTSWITAGAPWAEHWSLRTPARPEPPKVAGAPWVRDPLDRFVLARLEQEQLAPAPEADPATLLRRLSLDLTGLPPTLDELDTFLADKAKGAYDRAVERLLASPHFGERMAVEWLDRARYADTNGYSIDGGRHMWAWRDWVIQAYNQNKPFDEFTVEQLAGDLLPNATLDTRIASGFNRNHMVTHEGGTIEEEYRVAYVVDRVKTTAQTWMGLTMACAQCHDHKYDPISQAEYYRFFAYFNTITDRGNDGNGGRNAAPFLGVPFPEDRVFARTLRAQLADTEAQLAEASRVSRADPELRLEWEQALLDWSQVRQPPALGPWTVSESFVASSGDVAFDTAFGPELGDPDVAWNAEPELVDGEAFPLTGQNTATYFRRSIYAEESEVVELSLGSDDAIQVWHGDERVISKRTQRAVAPDQETLRLVLHPGANQILIKIVNYGGPGGFYFNIEDSGPDAALMRALEVPPEHRSPVEHELVDTHFEDTAPAFAEIRERMAELRVRLDELDARALTTTMVMQEQAIPRATYVLNRGQYDQPLARVRAGTPGCLPPMPPGEEANRLGLARWLVDPAHPLTARVAVNGLWQMIFGAGLVETSEDFGTQGALPSHPKLLDYLALEFIGSGWDVKDLLRRMVSSATYRQSSAVRPELRSRDPRNRLLARGPRFRLAAEFVRDNALAVSGLLVSEIGGPSVKPYQPAGLWREMSHFGSTPATEQIYEQGSGSDLYRRGLYTVLKRTVPPPSMAAFDAPNRELCVSRRLPSNTPLQALVVMNDPTYVEAARVLAQRMLLEGGSSPEERAAYGYRLATSRHATDEEVRLLTLAAARETHAFAANPAAALALLAVGESQRDEALDPAEHGAWTVVASTLLNMSRTLTRD